MSTTTMSRTTIRTAPARPVRVAAARAGKRTHLTRRGRLVLVTCLALLLFAAFSVGRIGAEGATTMAPSPQLEQTVVQPGETLWGVATRIALGQDPRPVVDQIRRLNDLESSGIQAGQQLLLPKAA